MGNPNVTGGSALGVSVAGVDSADTSTTIVAQNLNRKGLIIANSDTGPLYIKYGTTASVASGGFTLVIPTGTSWVMPYPIYLGRIDGIWTASATGQANVTEL